MSTLLSARFLGIAEFGKYTLITFIIGFCLSFSDLGLVSVLQRRVALAAGAGDAQGALASARSSQSWTCSRMGLVLIPGVLLIHDKLGIACFVASLVLQGAVAGAGTYLWGTSKLKIIVRSQMFGSLLGGAALVLMCLQGNAERAFGVASLAFALPQISYLFGCDMPARSLLRLGRISFTRSDLAFGLSDFLGAQLNVLVFSKSEIIFFPAGAVTSRGQFAAAGVVGQRATLAVDALFGSIPSALTTLYGRGELAFKRGLGEVLGLSSTLLGCSIPILSLWASRLAPTLFGSSYSSISIPITVLLAVSLAQTGLQPIVAARFAEKRMGPLLKASVMAGILDVSLAAALVPTMHLRGAVIANSVSGSAYILIVTVGFFRDHPSDRFTAYVKVVAAMVLAGIALSVLAGTLPLAPAVGCLVLTPACVVISALALRLTGTYESTEVLRVLQHISNRSRRLQRMTLFIERSFRRLAQSETSSGPLKV